MRNFEYRIEPVTAGGFVTDTDEHERPMLTTALNNTDRRVSARYTLFEVTGERFHLRAITTVLCWNDVQFGFNLFPVQSSSLCLHTSYEHDDVPAGLDLLDAHTNVSCELNPGGCIEFELVDVNDLLPGEVDAYLNGGDRADHAVIEYLLERWHHYFAPTVSNA